MLSKRGSRSAASQDIPWRFAPGGDDRYDKETNPTGVISFGTAENNLVQEELEKFVAEKVTIPASAFTYRSSTMGGPSFPKAMATHINEYFYPFTPIDPSHILTSAALTAMHEMLSFSLADEGEGILVSRPIYGRFELDFGNTASLEIVYADMNGVDPFSEDVVGNYERAFEDAAARGVVVKALLIVNPHNPLGRCYPPETLKAIMGFCEKKSIHLISDEVYALSVYDTQSESAPGFTSVLSFDPTDLISTDRLHVLYGMSKDFAAAGLRLGCLITQNSNLRKAITANIRFHNPSGPAIEIGTAILNDRPFVSSFIAKSRQRLSEARKFTTQVLDSVGIRYAGGGNAGFFTYIDLSPWLPEDIEEVTGNEREYALAQRLLDGGVGLHPCEEHYDVKGHFRLVFSHERDVLEVGLTRLLRVLGFDVAGLEDA